MDQREWSDGLYILEIGLLALDFLLDIGLFLLVRRSSHTCPSIIVSDTGAMWHHGICPSIARYHSSLHTIILNINIDTDTDSLRSTGDQLVIIRG